MILEGKKEEEEMIYKRIFLYENSEDVYMDVYAADKLKDYKRKALLVIPGGGYAGICANREGEPITLAFMAKGYNAFVLHYSILGRRVFPAQLIEASMAMKYIKDHAEEYGIDPEKVYVAGFSAGGHLAGMIGTMWNRKEVYETISMPYGYNKPAGMILMYPVIQGLEEYSNKDCFYRLLGTETPSIEQLAEVSIEKTVSKDAVPAYILHTADDAIVDVKNSLRLAEAYLNQGMTVELHIYPSAPHGIALGNEITRCGVDGWVDPAIALWVDQAVLWADKM